jgi:hypothetical protein
VEVVLLVEVDVELDDVEVLVELDDVVEVVETVGTGTPQCASVQSGWSPPPSAKSSVTRQVSEGSAQCENWIALMSHSAPAAQRGALGSTHKHPAKITSP